MKKAALLSVSDKTGLVEFARALAQADYLLLSTGGTAKALKDAGLAVTEVADWTGSPEMLEGRVKTLHPKVHGSILWKREDADHAAQAQAAGLADLDVVVVNLYPFTQTIAKPGCTRADAVEMIDIGGPSMVRSAAKNHSHVTVIADPADYPRVAQQLSASGKTSRELREALAAKAYAHTSRYDAAIAAYLSGGQTAEQAGQELPERLEVVLERAQGLRYGENPHQKAARYRVANAAQEPFEQLQGKELSYNNWLDISAAAQLMDEFRGEPPALAILKHTNPCGVGTAATLAEAWQRAFDTDRQAPFGGIITSNVPLDGATAEAIAEIFSEVIIAPDFSPEALEKLKKKKNLRLVRDRRGGRAEPSAGSMELRSIAGGQLLAQTADSGPAVPADAQTVWKVVTQRAPTPAEWQALRFGWRVVKHVKSNAIVYAGPDRTLGIGAGQMSRVDSSRIAVWKAQSANLSLAGSIVASDAFFPFPDGLLAAADAGATAVIQPGGSVRDAEVIAAANERGLAMVFTGLRHFRH